MSEGEISIFQDDGDDDGRPIPLSKVATNVHKRKAEPASSTPNEVAYQDDEDGDKALAAMLKGAKPLENFNPKYTPLHGEQASSAKSKLQQELDQCADDEDLETGFGVPVDSFGARYMKNCGYKGSGAVKEGGLSKVYRPATIGGFASSADVKHETSGIGRGDIVVPLDMAKQPTGTSGAGTTSTAGSSSTHVGEVGRITKYANGFAEVLFISSTLQFVKEKIKREHLRFAGNVEKAEFSAREKDAMAAMKTAARAKTSGPTGRPAPDAPGGSAPAVGSKRTRE